MISLSQISPAVVQNRIGRVSQMPHIVKGTILVTMHIRANIKFGLIKQWACVRGSQRPFATIPISVPTDIIKAAVVDTGVPDSLIGQKWKIKY